MLNCNRAMAKAVLSRAISQYGRPTLSQIRPDTTDNLSTTTKSPLIQNRKTIPKDPSEINLESANIITRAHAKLTERQPLVKNFFVAHVDREMLAYPEVLDKDELDKIVSVLRPVTNYFASKEPARNPEQLFKDTNDFKLLDGAVPELYGGKSHFSTETYLSAEAESVIPSDALIFNAHRLVITVITEHGTKEQQKKYLPKLGKCEWIGSVAITERDNDPINVLTTAELTENETDWILNGNFTISNIVHEAIESPFIINFI